MNYNIVEEQIINAMKEKKNDAIVEHFMGVYLTGNSILSSLNDFLYFAQISKNTHWMRKLTKRGALDMNTFVPMTDYEINMCEKCWN